jgi:hypothetical protein
MSEKSEYISDLSSLLPKEIIYFVEKKGILGGTGIFERLDVESENTFVKLNNVILYVEKNGVYEILPEQGNGTTLSLPNYKFSFFKNGFPQPVGGKRRYKKSKKNKKSRKKRRTLRRR